MLCVFSLCFKHLFVALSFHLPVLVCVLCVSATLSHVHSLIIIKHFLRVLVLFQCSAFMEFAMRFINENCSKILYICCLSKLKIYLPFMLFTVHSKSFNGNKTDVLKRSNGAVIYLILFLLFHFQSVSLDLFLSFAL